MISHNGVPNLLFIINPASGSKNTDWNELIETYLKDKQVKAELRPLAKDCTVQQLKDTIAQIQPDKVIAAGGDGTIKLVAEALMGTSLPMGILPAGSANGMAKEFGIPDDPLKALDVVMTGQTAKIHLVKVNDEICVHLSDIGFNAFMVKKFEEENIRGMWGYIRASWKVLWRHGKMNVQIKCDNDYINRNASMVVIANGTKYGNGVVINPMGSLFDQLFEVVIIKQISLIEIFKMRFFSNQLDVTKTELLQTTHLVLASKRNLHFQVDGEYLGKTKNLVAEIIPDGITVIVP